MSHKHGSPGHFTSLRQKAETALQAHAVFALWLLLAASPDAGTLLTRPVEISAEKLEVRQKEQRAIYSGHAKAVRDTLTMTCDQIDVEYAKNNDVSRVLAHGHVEAVDGERWAAGDEADFDNTTGVLVVRGNPQARQGKRSVTGQLVTFVTGTDTVDVTTARTITTDDKGPKGNQRVQIDADQLTLKNKESTAVWRGHVKAVRGATTIRAPLLTATYDDDGNITKVEGTGGVEATEGDRWARGQHATYDATTGVLVLTGKPEARQAGNRMKGTKVTFFTGRDFIEVENATTVISKEKKK